MDPLWQFFRDGLNQLSGEFITAKECMVTMRVTSQEYMEANHHCFSTLLYDMPIGRSQQLSPGTFIFFSAVYKGKTWNIQDYHFVCGFV
jgi:hypothetical protein